MGSRETLTPLYHTIDRRRNIILNHIHPAETCETAQASGQQLPLVEHNNTTSSSTIANTTTTTTTTTTAATVNHVVDHGVTTGFDIKLLEFYGTSGDYHNRSSSNNYNNSSSDEIVTYHPNAHVAGVSLLKIRNPPVNALSSDTLNSLQRAVNRCYEDPSCRAFVLCSEINDFFVAGADIAWIQRMQQEGDESMLQDFINRNNDLLNMIESGPKPSVAAIDGTALGGGCELLMACNARICTPSSNIGLPELKLGLIPGFGGTQRLPRLVGVRKAVEMMLLSKSVRGTEAHIIGLVDELVHPEIRGSQLLRRASEMALDLAEYRRGRKVAMVYNGALEPEHVVQAALEEVETRAKRAPHLPHQLACINAIRAGIEYNGFYGLETEKAEFAKVAVTPSAKAFVHFFFASRATSKIPNVSQLNKPRNIRTVGILGGGTMGSGIVIACLEAGMNVILKEVTEKFLEAGVQRVRKVFQSRVDRGKLTSETMNRYMSLLRSQIDYKGFDSLDLVIEAVLEKPELKQQVFQELDRVCSSDCILATNTSTIDVDLIGSKTRAQKRIIGLHFFSPAHIMQLLEIIRTDSVDVQVLADMLHFSKKIRKTPVVVGNCSGFVVNRVFFPYGQASHLLVDYGLDPYRIDEVVKQFGMPMGPFRMNDLAGGDILFHAYGSMATAYKKFTYPTHLNNLLVAAGRLGEKTGKGIYKHEYGRAHPDSDLYQFITAARRRAGNPTPLSLTDKEIIEYVFYPAVNEACRVIEERMVYRVSDIDIATILGIGFPVWRGGLVKWADMIGADKIYDRLMAMQSETGSKLFQPCDYLRECAQRGKSLFDAQFL